MKLTRRSFLKSVGALFVGAALPKLKELPKVKPKVMPKPFIVKEKPEMGNTFNYSYTEIANPGKRMYELIEPVLPRSIAKKAKPRVFLDNEEILGVQNVLYHWNHEGVIIRIKAWDNDYSWLLDKVGTKFRGLKIFTSGQPCDCLVMVTEINQEYHFGVCFVDISATAVLGIPKLPVSP